MAKLKFTIRRYMRRDDTTPISERVLHQWPATLDHLYSEVYAALASDGALDTLRGQAAIESVRHFADTTTRADMLDILVKGYDTSRAFETVLQPERAPTRPMVTLRAD